MKNVMQTKKLVKNVSFAAVSLLILAACAQNSSDPLADYQLKGETPTEIKREQQTIAPQVFAIQIEGASQQNYANFTEGETSSVLIKVIRKSNKIQNYSLAIIDFPAAEAPTLTPTGMQDIWRITWKPQAGFIPAGVPGKDLSLNINATVTDADKSELLGLTSSQTIPAIVSRNISQPKIVGRSENLAAGIDEGKMISFHIDVEDPASLNYANKPKVEFIPYTYDNVEAFAGNISRLIDADNTKKDNPVQISSTKWRFFFTLKINDMQIDLDRKGKANPNASSLDLCTYIRAYSAVKTPSGDSELCLKGRYAAKNATVNWTQPNITEINAGENVQLDFQATVDSNLGKTVVTNTSVAAGGTKDLKCEVTSREDENLTQTCQLNFKPTCVTKDTKRVVKVSVTHTLNQKTKVQTVERELLVKPSEANCPVQVKAPVKSTAKKATSSQQSQKSTSGGQ